MEQRRSGDSRRVLVRNVQATWFEQDLRQRDYAAGVADLPAGTVVDAAELHGDGWWLTVDGSDLLVPGFDPSLDLCLESDWTDLDAAEAA